MQLTSAAERDGDGLLLVSRNILVEDEMLVQSRSKLDS
jgi:hypothetical protein